ncbi:MAG: zinc-binding alcohol dehydrogenase family protein [Parvibaculum sp.]|uniref:zinc-binding alcohol dehydrogenase family protein n=1 Tax=Parvibaculum sp. TaxID=2024848 RepID=UPI00283EE708|nr:zinc-binding alcohol dehydrogenase family protein [Parvibaculum sp.]MDR3497892.1 zinc-binding alcohol dehydrogenase family protein [Parvibaculum sp.]
MKAAILKSLGTPLAVETLPDPAPGAGEVAVDVHATRVLAYTNEVFSGARNYLLELPIVPGAGGVGRVRAVGPDATQLAVGDWVFCDPTVRARDDAVNPDIVLQGLTAAGPRALPLQRYFRHGSFAEQMLAPMENVSRIGAIEAADAGRWCVLGMYLVPYGGLLAVDLRAGETVVVNGATGGFGSAGVAVALAMGAGCVVATGRNEAALADLARRFDKRLRVAAMSGDEDADRQRIMETAAGPIDCVLDLLPPMATPAQVRAAVLAVRPGGRVVLMGGVGMAGGGDLALPYAWMMRNNITVRGQWLCPRDAVPRMIGLVRSGLLDPGQFDIAEFDLAHVNDAVAHAAAYAGPFQTTVLRP